MLGWVVSLVQLLSSFISDIGHWFTWLIYMFISLLMLVKEAIATYTTVVPLSLSAAFMLVITVLVVRFCIRLGR